MHDHSTHSEALDNLVDSSPIQHKRQKIRQRLRTDGWIDSLDQVAVLGDADGGHSDGSTSYGHTGCINALSWSSDGKFLASGSDDTKVCLWALGNEYKQQHPQWGGLSSQTPDLGMSLHATIKTGHRANIFSVKFAPFTSNRRLFSCAGDHEVRVFDLTNATSGETVTSGSRQWTYYNDSTPRSTGPLLRVFKCHRDRVKRIATEGSPDVFLTCSEDCTVRQHDLRVPHNCLPRNNSGCPSPLVSYYDSGISLYSLSTSVLRPELFVVAGTSPFAFLHDRRMIPRALKDTWGVTASPTEMTQCVRKFTLPQCISKDKGHDALAARRRRFRTDELHVTAAKLSETNGRELAVSFSGGPVALFDIFDDPAVPTEVIEKPAAKRRRSSHSSRTPAEASPPKASRSESDSAPAEPATKRTFDYEVTIDDNGELQYTSQIIPEDHDTNETDADYSHSDHQSPQTAVPDSENADGISSSGESQDQEALSAEMVGASDDETDSSEDARLEADFLEKTKRRLERERQAGGDVPICFPRQTYDGHRNVDTVKDVGFVFNDSYVISGSDDGSFFIWDKETAELKGVWEGDDSVVNVMQGHPSLPVIAVSGIDDTAKIFAPTINEEKRASRLDKAEEIRIRNKDRTWTSDGLSAPPSHIYQLLLQQLSARNATVRLGGEDENDEDGPRRRAIRILRTDGGDDDGQELECPVA